MAWLVEAILGALVELSVAILGFFWDAAEPETGAAWFSGGESTPYGEMVVLAAPLLVVFFLAGVIQGVVKGDTAGMLRMALVRLPGAVLAMSVTVAVTDLLLQVTNDMSEAVLGGFRDDVEATTQMLETVAATPGLAGAGPVPDDRVRADRPARRGGAGDRAVRPGRADLHRGRAQPADLRGGGVGIDAGRGPQDGRDRPGARSCPSS